MRSQHNLLITGGVGRYGKAMVLFSNGECREFLSVADGEIYGVAEFEGTRFVAIRGTHPRIARINSSLVCDKVISIPASDPHCVYIENNVVHLVSSSEDTIHRFDLDLNQLESQVFGLGGDRRYHVNDVTKIGSNFFVSMFTDKGDGKWNDHANQGLVKTGGVVSPPDMKWAIAGLIKPHNPTLFKDDLWVSDSGRGAVWCNSTKVFHEPRSWTRGLCVDGDYIHTGVSCENRQRSSKIVTLTRTGDIVRQAAIPLTFVYGIQLL